MRIKLINCNKQIINWVLNGDQALMKNMNINVPKNWNGSGTIIFKMALDSCIKNPDSLIWHTYLPIEENSNTLIGTCGFKGVPQNGHVEIGYEVCKAFRNRGFATEMVEQLIQIAFKDKDVQAIVAHTLRAPNPSVQVLKKCGFSFVNEFVHEEDGVLQKWILTK